MLNKLRMGSALLFLVLFAATAIFGASDRRMTADIPFDFIVGEKVMPAGEYSVSRLRADSPGFLVIRSTDGRAMSIINTHAAAARNGEIGAHLIFQRVGGSYYLSEVQPGYGESARRLYPPRVERDAEESEIVNLR